MSFLITTGRPARGLLALSGFGTRNTGSRGYAKAIQPRKQPAPAPATAPALNPQPPPPLFSPGKSTLLFSKSDVPTAEKWQSALRILENKDLTAAECLHGANTYVSIATQYESIWRAMLRDSFTPHFLHWLAVLALAPTISNSWKLGVHMLRSASEMGYAPSTLTLRRFFHSMHRKPDYGKIKETVHFRAVNARFEDILIAGRDPDAFTLQGIILNDQGQHDDALTSFRRAHEAWALSQPGRESDWSPVPPVEHLNGGRIVLPKAREPRWEWEIACLLGEADIHKMHGHLKKATALYRVAALELDNVRGFHELATSMNGPRDSPERRVYLLKAAVSGQVEAFRELGAVEEMRAHEKGITEREMEHRLQLSKEWLRLADSEDART